MGFQGWLCRNLGQDVGLQELRCWLKPRASEGCNISSKTRGPSLPTWPSSSCFRHNNHAPVISVSAVFTTQAVR